MRVIVENQAIPGTTWEQLEEELPDDALDRTTRGILRSEPEWLAGELTLGEIRAVNESFGAGLELPVEEPTGPPLINISIPETADTGEEVSFTATDQSPAESTFNWYYGFGDPDTGDEPDGTGTSVTATFQQPGTVTVILQVESDEAPLGSIERTLLIEGVS